MTAHPPPRIPNEITVMCVQQFDGVTDMYHCWTTIQGQRVKVHVYLQPEQPPPQNQPSKPQQK